MTSDQVYFDETGYAAFRRVRRPRAAVVFGLLLGGLGVAFFRGDVSL